MISILFKKLYLEYWINLKILWNMTSYKRVSRPQANVASLNTWFKLYNFFIRPSWGLLPVLGPREWYMTPTLDAALLSSSRAGADLGQTSDISPRRSAHPKVITRAEPSQRGTSLLRCSRHRKQYRKKADSKKIKIKKSSK